MYNVIFMGTPDFAVPSLQKLIDTGANVLCAVTQPDKPVGRKQILTASPVKQLAEKHGIPVYQPNTLKTDEAYDYLRSFEPDFVIVVAYGKILPKRILDLPKIACVNVHGSLLPKYRGAAPIQWSVINGDSITGVTTMLMGEGIDTGDILKKTETAIGENETAGELFDRLSFLGADLLAETLKDFSENKITPQQQDENLSSYVSTLSKETAKIDWNKSCKEIFNLVRGLNPWPVAYTDFNGKKIKIFSCEYTDIVPKKEIGAVYAEKGKAYAVCSNGVLHITELQVEGRKRMTDSAFLNGHSF